MFILGIDPGTFSIGYSILKGGVKPHLEESGLVRITKKGGAERLKELYEGLRVLLKKWEPEAVAVEKLFFAKNTKTAISVSEARGVILLTTALAGLRPYEYTPLEVKKTVTGDGRADKIQIKKMVQLILPETRELRARDDVFDAIAVALTCHFKERRNWTEH